MVRDKHAGSALVIPRGTDAALHNGEPVALVLYVDSAKYLERLNVRARLLEVGDAVAAEQRRRIVGEAEEQRTRLRLGGILFTWQRRPLPDVSSSQK